MVPQKFMEVSGDVCDTILFLSMFKTYFYLITAILIID